MTQRQAEPQRFRDLMKQVGRNRDASRVAVSILRADSKVGQAMERALSEADMTGPQFNVLMELASSPGATLPLYEITQRLISTPPNTSWICTRMEDGGLVRRQRDRRDARVVNISLTEKGWAALAKAAPLVFHTEKELLGDFSRAELRDLGDLLGRLIRPGDTSS